AGRGWRGGPRRPRTAPPAHPRTHTEQRRQAPPAAKGASTWSTVDDLGAAVLRPRVLTRALGRRLLLAEAHGLDLRVVHAQQGERAAHGLGALLAQRQVVLAAAALVGVAFDGDLARRVGLQEAGMAVDHRLELGLDGVAVEVEIDDPCHPDRALARLR